MFGQKNIIIVIRFILRQDLGGIEASFSSFSGRNGN